MQSNAGLTVATRTLAVDTSGAGRLFVGAPTLGIYRTRSAGAIWTLLNNGLTDRDVVDLVVAPSDPTVLYAVSNFNTLFASTDYGRSFAVRPTGFVPPHTTGIQALAVDPADPQHLLLGAVTIDESRDGGTTWQAVAGGPSAVAFSLQFAASDPAVAYAAGLQAASQPQNTSGFLFASADGGTWQVVSADQQVDYAVDASQASRLYAFGQSGVAISTDGGVTFAPTSLGQPISCVTTSPHLPGFVAACGQGTVWLSRDGGASWSSLSDGLTAQTVFASLVFDPVLPGTLYGSTGPGGVYALSF